jgi:cyclic pyranopterin phosphate synthase
MAEDMTFLPRARILTLEEIAQLGRAFVDLGVTKIRITGGEPLVRRDVINLFYELGALPGLKELALTTNGSQLPRYADDLREAGVRRINISLDTLDSERFRRMTRVGELDAVLAGIEAAKAAGFERIKINTVVLKHYNDDEVPQLVEFCIEQGVDISFIEEMPLGVIGDHDRAAAFYSSEQIRDDLAPHFDLVPTTESTGGPSRYWRVRGADTRVGFISPHSHNFCATCNRVRVTVEGRLLLCLGQEHSVDLRHTLRSAPGDMDKLKRAVIQSMQIKPKGHEFALGTAPVIMRHMNATGG